VTLEAKRVKKLASSMAESPPPTTMPVPQPTTVLPRIVTLLASCHRWMPAPEAR